MQVDRSDNENSGAHDADSDLACRRLRRNAGQEDGDSGGGCGVVAFSPLVVAVIVSVVMGWCTICKLVQRYGRVLHGGFYRTFSVGPLLSSMKVDLCLGLRLCCAAGGIGHGLRLHYLADSGGV